MSDFCERKRRILCGLINEVPVQSSWQMHGAEIPTSKDCKALPLKDPKTSSDPNCSKPDRSLKGLVDAGLVPICDFLNNHHDFVTTSCCSGRITCYQHAANDAGSRLKSQGHLVFVSHGYVELGKARDILELVKRGQRYYPLKKGSSNSPQNHVQADEMDGSSEDTRATVEDCASCNAMQFTGVMPPGAGTGEESHSLGSLFVSTDLKFEPLILHVECRDTAAALLLLSAALTAGLKQSGINSLGKRNVVAIRGSQRLEVPLTKPFANTTRSCCSLDKPVFNSNGIAGMCSMADVAVDEAYMKLLLTNCNQRLKVNEAQIRRLKVSLEQHLSNAYPSAKFKASGSLLPQAGSLCSRCLKLLRQPPSKCEVEVPAQPSAASSDELPVKEHTSGCKASVSPAYVGVSIQSQVEAVRTLLQAAELLDTTRHIKVIKEPSHLSDLMKRVWCLGLESRNTVTEQTEEGEQILAVTWLALIPVTGCSGESYLSQVPKELSECPGLLKNTRGEIRVFTLERSAHPNVTACTEQSEAKIVLPLNAHPAVVMNACLRLTAKRFPLIEKALEATMKEVNQQFPDANDVTRGAHCPHIKATPGLERLILHVPSKYERLGDILLFPKGALDEFHCLIDRLNAIVGAGTNAFALEVLYKFALHFKAKAIGIQMPIIGDMRQSQVKAVFGSDFTTVHKENGVSFFVDVTRCMFASGNGTERRRLPALVGSTGVSELVVDMFCGIGYFSLGALKKNKSEKLSHLFACDINPDALRCFNKSLALNHIDTSRVTLLLCDSCAPLDGNACHSCERNSALLVQEVRDSEAALDAKLAVMAGFSKSVRAAMWATLPRSLMGCIHRVFLGLLPDSSKSWENAVKLLHEKMGGYLHIHGVASLDFVSVDSSWRSVVIEPNGETHVTVFSEDEVISDKLWSLSFGQHILKAIVPHATKKAAATYHSWRASISHIEKVKSYSPKKYHFVVDLHIHPVT